MARILSTPTKQHPPTIRAPILTPRDVKLTRDTKTFPGVVIIVAIIIGCFVLALFCGLLINHMRKVRKGREEHARREVRRGCAPPGLESPVAKCVVKMNRFKPIRPIRLEELQKPAPAVRSRDCHIMRMWAGDRNAQGMSIAPHPRFMTFADTNQTTVTTETTPTTIPTTSRSR
jgi:hypothetical protein